MADSVIPVPLGKLPHYNSMPLGGVLVLSVPDRQDASKKRFATLLPRGLTVGTVNAPGGGTVGLTVVETVPSGALIPLYTDGLTNYISPADLYAGMVSGAIGGNMAANGATVTAIPNGALVPLSVNGATNYITPANLYAAMQTAKTAPAESANGATITDTFGALYDAAGNKFSLVTAMSPQTGYGVAYNNTYQSPTSNVNLGLWYDHSFYQRNTAGAYYRWTGTTFGPATTDPRLATVPSETLAVTTPASQTAGVAFTLRGTYTNGPPTALDYSINGGTTWIAAASPVIGSGAYSFSATVAVANSAQTIMVRDHVAPTITATSGSFTVVAAATAFTPSPDPTAVSTVGPSITDSTGAVSTLNSSGQVVTGGAIETNTSGVNLLYYTASKFYQRNTAGNFYLRTGPNAYATNPVADPRFAESANGTLVTTVGTKLTDSARITSSITSAAKILTDGFLESAANITTLYKNANGFFVKDASNNWYKRTSPNTYTGPVSDPTVATTTIGNGRFQASNGKFLKPDGTNFRGMGLNVTPYTGYAPSLYPAVKNKFPGISLIRVVTGIGWTQGGQDQPTYENFINVATADGVVCIIDGHSIGTVRTGQALTDAANWYATLANKYKTNPYVWFNTPNEPNGDYAQIAAEELAIYNAIRNTGNSHPILMELRGGGYTEWMSGKGSTWSGMTNVGWDTHFYGYLTGDYTTSGSYNKAATAQALANETAAAQAYQSADGVMPCIVGEFGPSTSGGANTTDANSQEVINAVFNSTFGFCAWALTGTSSPGGDSMYLDETAGTLTPWGQQVAAKIAAG